ncbi:nicotinate-nucleotide adenylyltransferase NadD [Legionella beliardensis]|uniref:Probable nicotinate-nucleotide adenylyltransferase n=1 Tax=Legionella beliardensis TaxID=91822 RepID=A0A378I2V3_9GAMM|nr:nicotinate-nucleotide adenylyltransferase [Legionella beliardensis]STX29031.1 nicotinate-nucleotide adenylyltransferase NadD [Legionella beliardensis]
MPNLIIFGGTFDPIHNGHLNTAINVQQFFHFERFIFLPCKVPILKNKALATTTQRLDMLKLALKEQDQTANFAIDTREITRTSPSYMVTTLEDYRRELGQTLAISLLIGVDSFATLTKWYQWERLLHLANLVVIDRPGYHIESQVLLNLLKNHETSEVQQIKNVPNGLIFKFNAGLYDLSSTAIRSQIQQGYLLNADVPKSVANYIKEHQIYTRIKE